ASLRRSPGQGASLPPPPTRRRYWRRSMASLPAGAPPTQPKDRPGDERTAERTERRDAGTERCRERAACGARGYGFGRALQHRSAQGILAGAWWRLYAGLDRAHRGPPARRRRRLAMVGARARPPAAVVGAT